MAFVGDREIAGGPDFVSIMGVGFMAYLTFLFSMQLPWAFRGDIDHMDFLKTLPVAPLALAVGELAGGVVLLAAIQLVLLIGSAGRRRQPRADPHRHGVPAPVRRADARDEQHAVLDLPGAVRRRELRPISR